MVRAAFFILLLVAGAQPAVAASWRMVSSGGEPPQRVAYWIDADSVRRQGDEVWFRYREVLETPDEDKRTGIAGLVRAACGGTDYRFLELTEYLVGGESPTYQASGMVRTAAPNTYMGGLKAVACGRREAGPVAPDPDAATRASWAGQ